MFDALGGQLIPGVDLRVTAMLSKWGMARMFYIHLLQSTYDRLGDFDIDRNIDGDQDAFVLYRRDLPSLVFELLGGFALLRYLSTYRPDMGFKDVLVESIQGGNSVDNQWKQEAQKLLDVLFPQ
jgi:hypothetical protein